ncbi:MAG: 3-deoxy-8-phosphooctulonate synthase [Deferribacteraceae bacterium]|jgi:2-dehydro-3-deoxyphosphooctonate aldolase (KDO 8-P synthase)|nr:3-deoxy-8-phosphooctulonate synthase [Deferribacteraceae bacterium]
MLYNKLKSKPFLIAGPCVMESADMVMKIAEECVKIASERNIEYIFKASFDKANRTSASSYRGLGMDEGLQLLQRVKDTFNVPVTTDIHESYQAEAVGEVVDILQIPAFLCRQTDLLVAAAATGRIVNIKKAQFLSAADMIHPLEKVRKAGNMQVMLTERGTMFGYNNLVVDFRNLVEMREMGVPVVMDVTHSTQRPGGLGGKSGGDRKFAPYIAAAAAAVGVDGYFFEVHPEPDSALSDGPNMIPLDQFGSLLDNVLKHHRI